MKKFIIKRQMDGAGSIPKNELNLAGKNSEEILDAMRSEGKNIPEELIKEHSERSGAPATEISEVSSVIRHNTSFVS